MDKIDDIHNEIWLYNKQAKKLLRWAIDTGNRIKANKLIKLALKLENKYRNNHYNKYSFNESFINPLHF